MEVPFSFAFFNFLIFLLFFIFLQKKKINDGVKSLINDDRIFLTFTTAFNWRGPPEVKSF